MAARIRLEELEPRNLLTAIEFSSPIRLSSEFSVDRRPLAIGDIDQDGDMDVATLVTEGIFTRRGSNPYLWTRIDWYINVDGRGTFELSADRVPLTDFRHPDPKFLSISTMMAMTISTLPIATLATEPKNLIGWRTWTVGLRKPSN